jgi:acyl-coenzyme A synthetase/AMP-(fatty) acid ligase
MDSLPDEFPKPPNLGIVSFGATLSESLRERTTARLATALHDCYGSREVGSVSRISAADSGGIGVVRPTCEVDVVDEHGRSLPRGQLGRLRIKTPFMHREYVGNPEATAEFFRDGWFHSGDLAIMHGPRHVRIMGRADDLLNVGGTKMLPTSIEELVLRAVNAKDVGVSSVRNQHGVEELLIGVAEAPLDDRELQDRISTALRWLQFGTVHLARLPTIPRNAGGKIQRDQLKQALCRATGVTDADLTGTHPPS